MSLDKNTSPTAEVTTSRLDSPYSISTLIFFVRGKQVLLDKDVARLYQYSLKAMNQAVKRNLNRFPPSFRFQLTGEELEELRSQNVTAISNMTRTKPYVYTEHGVAMLAGLLKSAVAERMSVEIINAFISMRDFFCAHKSTFDNLSSFQKRLDAHDHKLLVQSNQIEEILDALATIQGTQEQMIFYEGQFYDAYVWVKSIIKKAKRSILVIDNYIDTTVFRLLEDKRGISVSVTIITRQRPSISKDFIDDWEKHFGPVSVIHSNIFHDRFIVVDNAEVYHIGASLKDLGKKCFAVCQQKNADAFLMHLKKIIEMP